MRQAVLIKARDWKTEGLGLLQDLIPKAVANGIVSLAHPLVQNWIDQVQFRLSSQRMAIRVGAYGEEQRQQAEESIRVCRDELERLGGTALIDAVEKDYEDDISVIRAKRSNTLLEEAKPVFEVWKPLKDADNRKKLTPRKGKDAMAERRRRVAKALPSDWGASWDARMFTPGSTDYYESIYRGFIDEATVEQRSDRWVSLFEESGRTDKQVCQYAVNRRLAEEVPEIDERSLKVSIRIGRRKLRKKT